MSRALWHVSPEHSELREVRRPADQALLKVDALYSMVSTGTERLIASGDVDPDCNRTMRVPGMEGGFELPIKYGYSLVGRDASGRVVHCMHPHQTTVYVAEDGVLPAPEGVPAKRMALLSNVETAVNAMWDAGTAELGNAVICGFGSVGSLLATVLRLSKGVIPVIVEKNSWRRKRASDLGYETIDPTESRGEFPVFFNTTGKASALQWCIDNAGREAEVVELSWYGNRSVTLDLGNRFHRNRVSLVSSQVSSIPRSVNFSVADRKRLCAELLTDDSFDKLISNEITLQESPRFFADLRNGQEGEGIIWVIKY